MVHFNIFLIDNDNLGDFFANLVPVERIYVSNLGRNFY